MEDAKDQLLQQFNPGAAMAEAEAKIEAMKKKMIRAEQVGKQLSDFEDDLTRLVNKHSLENLCGTPDFIIAGHLANQVMVLAGTVNDREKWYGREQDSFGMPVSTPGDMPAPKNEDTKVVGPHVYTHPHKGLNCRCLKLCTICNKPESDHQTDFSYLSKEPRGFA